MHESETGSLVVLSNRLPVTVKRTRTGPEISRSSGGLVSALDPALKGVGGTWVGWPGDARRFDADRVSRELGYRIEPVFLTQAQVRDYYHGFSNRTLWPLFHSFSGRVKIEPREWGSYETVNECMANATLRVASETDLIWVHDYHLLRAAVHVRERMPAARLAFFLHIPFPPFDIFRILPWARRVLHGMLSCDLVGLHCPSYVGNFFDCAERLLSARMDRVRGQIEYGARTVRVGAFPLGIDFAAYARQAESAGQPSARRKARVILGVDRLDYTKGIPQRIQAFERLLELHPQHRGNVVLVQLAVPSRVHVEAYQALKREIDELVGRVNGRFGSYGWTPIEYMYRSLSGARLATLYRDADVALVTPLRDGMNLVAKEYVACQVGDPGVLVLSRLAGAAETMHEALLVNPYDIDGVAAALDRALAMSADERTERMARLREREERRNVYRWLQEFLTAARGPAEAMRPLDASDFEGWLAASLRERRLALFVDYDGTLTPLVDHPSQATLLPEVRALLARCVQRPDTDVVVISGREIRDVEKLVGVPDVFLVGNHGLEIEGPGLPRFEHPDASHYRARIAELARQLDAGFAHGVWVEQKGVSLTLHYRGADPHEREHIAAEARALIGKAGFQPRDAHCAVEARPPIGWDKGRALLHLLRSRYGPAWSERVHVIYAGDDETDEDAFRALSGLGTTFRVGSSTPQTEADRRLEGPASVHALLEWIAHRPAFPV
jgi:trehalose 6-phosphate synthase/phosphatase